MFFHLKSYCFLHTVSYHLCLMYCEMPGNGRVELCDCIVCFWIAWRRVQVYKECKINCFSYTLQLVDFFTKSYQVCTSSYLHMCICMHMMCTCTFCGDPHVKTNVLLFIYGTDHSQVYCYTCVLTWASANLLKKLASYWWVHKSVLNAHEWLLRGFRCERMHTKLLE